MSLTKTEVQYNEDLHFEHQQWQSEPAFWEDELKSFKNRLEELMSHLTKKKYWHNWSITKTNLSCIRES